MASAEVIIPIIGDYPFPGSSDAKANLTQMRAKKSLQFGLQPRFVMKQKVRMLKNLGFQHLIGLESTYQEENQLILLFQAVPFQLQPVVSTLTPAQVDSIKEGMNEFAQILVAHCVEHQFKVENIGLDKKNSVKYYLGFGFKIDRAMKKEDTLQRYKRIIQYFFAPGGPLIKDHSPNKSHKNENMETVDTSCKLSCSEESSHQLIPTSNLMKKSSTVPENAIKGQLSPQSKQMYSRYTFNCNQLIPEEDRKYYDEERNVETKVVKMQELGARINRLKNFMKEITGKTPTNNSGMSRVTVKIDANNADNRIFQENKIMITPSYTKLEKKISEFRESKLYRAYNEKEILYSKNNQGYQMHTTQKIQDNSKPRANQPKTLQFLAAKNEPAKQAKQIKPQEERTGHVPSYLLQKKDSLNSAIKQSPVVSPKSHTSPPHFATQLKVQPQPEPFRSGVSSRNSLPKPSDPQIKEYRKLAEKDKYCEQFMFFLEGEDQDADFINGQINTQTPSSKPFFQQSPKELLKQAGSQHNSEIQDRVKSAIRNSIKLINTLKSKD